MGRRKPGCDGGGNFSADGGAGSVIFQRHRRFRCVHCGDRISLRQPEHHRGRRDDAYDYRRGRLVRFRDRLELGQRHRQQRRREHLLCDSELAAGHQHVGEPRLDDDEKCARRGADGRQCFRPLQQRSDWKFRRHELRRAAVGGLHRASEPARRVERPRARRIHQPDALCPRQGSELRLHISRHHHGE